jgi:hypothetical protein
MLIPDASQMLIIISNNIPQLIRMATAITYVVGTYIVIVAVVKLRNAPFISAAGQGQASAGTHIGHIFIGAAMIFVITFIHVGTATLFGEQTPFSYIPDNGSPLSQIYNAATSVLTLVGFIAFVRGIYDLGFGQGQNAQHGHISSINRATAYIVGGLLCLNLSFFISVVFNTLGITL